MWDDHDRLLISSFGHVCLETAMDIAGDWNRGLLLEGEELPENWKDLADYLEAATINISNQMVTRTAVEMIHDYEKPVLVYTVNDAQRARELQSWGVSAIFTDVPDVVADGILTVH